MLSTLYGSKLGSQDLYNTLSGSSVLSMPSENLFGLAYTITSLSCGVGAHVKAWEKEVDENWTNANLLAQQHEPPRWCSLHDPFDWRLPLDPLGFMSPKRTWSPLLGLDTITWRPIALAGAYIVQSGMQPLSKRGGRTNRSPVSRIWICFIYLFFVLLSDSFCLGSQPSSLFGPLWPFCCCYWSAAVIV